MEKNRAVRITGTVMELFPKMKKKLMRFDDNLGGGVTVPAHIQILVLLNEHGTLSVSEAGRRLMIAKPNMTPLVNRLADKDYVRREQDPHDRRTVNISVSEKGKQFLRSHTERMAQDIGVKLKVLSEREQERMEQSFSYLLELMNKIEDDV